MKNPVELMNEALNYYSEGNFKLGYKARIESLKLAFENELEFLKDTYGLNGFDKEEEFDNIIINRRKELKKAIKLAEGIQ